MIASHADSMKPSGVRTSGRRWVQLPDVVIPAKALCAMSANGPTGIDVGRELARNGIPYVFVSGNIKKIPDDFAGAMGAIEKPYTMNGMKNALTYISSVISGDSNAELPASLVLAEDAVAGKRLSQSLITERQCSKEGEYGGGDRDDRCSERAGTGKATPR